MSNTSSGRAPAVFADLPRHRPLGPLAAGIALAAVVLQVLLGRLLGTIDWGGCFCGDRAQTWTIGITAQVWYTASSVFIGALLSRRLLARGVPPVGQPEYFAAVVPPAATVFFVVPLVVALAAGADSPRAIASGIDIGASIPAGALMGALAALVVFSVPSLVRPIWLHIGWIWLLGLLSVVVSWDDRVGQTVPIGAVLIGGPGNNAAPIDRTMHDVTVSLMTVFAIVGPAVIGGWLAWQARSAGVLTGRAMAVGVAGPVFALAAYFFRPDALSGDNADALGLAAKTLLIAAVAAGAALLGHSVWNHPVSPHDPDYRSRHRQ
ncbi:MAG: hypothetical protein ACRDPW_08125 [Mycobacteriales bacterium]